MRRRQIRRKRTEVQEGVRRVSLLTRVAPEEERTYSESEAGMSQRDEEENENREDWERGKN